MNISAVLKDYVKTDVTTLEILKIKLKVNKKSFKFAL